MLTEALHGQCGPCTEEALKCGLLSFEPSDNRSSAVETSG